MTGGRTEQKAVLLTAIGILGLPEAIPKLEHIIKDQSQSTFIRTKAVFAFKRLIQSSNGNDAVSRSTVRNQVLPKLMSFVQSTSLPSPVRMAATSLVFSSEHSTFQDWSQISQLAVAGSNEFQSFVASSIQSMTQMSPITNAHKHMKHIASQLSSEVSRLAVARSSSSRNGISQNLYFAEEIGPKTEVEFFARFALLKSSRSNEFIHLFTKGSYNMGTEDPLELTPLAVSLSLQSKTNDVWKQADVYTTFSIWNQMFVSTKINPENFESIVRSTEVGRLIADWLDSSSSNNVNSMVQQVSFQKAIQPWEQIREVPTVLGYPVSFRMSMPIIISTEGQIAQKGSGSQARVHADVYLSAVGQIKARLTAKVPYTQKYYQVGYERNVAVELPLRIVAQKTHSQAIQFAITPTHLENHGQPSGSIRVLSYDQVPYTAIIKNPFARTMSDKYESYDEIRTEKNPSLYNEKYGKDELGLKFTYEVESDRPGTPSPGQSQTLKLQKKALWSNYMYRNVNVTLDLSNSRTNTVLFTFGHGRVAQLSNGPSGINNGAGEIQHGVVAAVAVTGKQAYIQPLTQKATTIQEIDSKSAKNTFQFFGQFTVSQEMDQVAVRVVSGRAADRAVQSLPTSGGLSVVREAITQSDNSQASQQESRCIEIFHKAKDTPQQNIMFGKTTIAIGDTCAAQELKEVKIETLIEIKEQIQAKIELVKADHVPQQLLQRLASRARQAVEQHQAKDRSSPLRVQVETTPNLTLKLAYAPIQSRQQLQQQSYQQQQRHHQHQSDSYESRPQYQHNRRQSGSQEYSRRSARAH
jgi:hypothetical protein